MVGLTGGTNPGVLRAQARQIELNNILETTEDNSLERAQALRALANTDFGSGPGSSGGTGPGAQFASGALSDLSGASGNPLVAGSGNPLLGGGGQVGPTSSGPSDTLNGQSEFDALLELSDRTIAGNREFLELDQSFGREQNALDRTNRLDLANIDANRDRDIAGINQGTQLGVADRQLAGVLAENRTQLGVAGINSSTQLGVADRDLAGVLSQNRTQLGVAGINSRTQLGVADRDLAGILSQNQTQLDLQDNQLGFQTRENALDRSFQSGENALDRQQQLDLQDNSASNQIRVRQDARAAARSNYFLR